MSDELQEIVELMPAYDKRNLDPKKNYGIHGVTLKMVLKGPEGAVQFVVYTNWQLPHVQEEIDQHTIERIARATKPKRSVKSMRGVRAEKIPAVLDQIESAVIPYDEGKMELHCFYHPMAADLGYHSPEPMYEGQEPMGSMRFDFEHKETLKGATGDIEIPTRVATGTFDACEYVNGGPCYYDGSSLNAERVYDVLLREGSKGVWRELREYYDTTFRSEK